MVQFSEFLKIWRMQSNSVTRQVNFFNRIKIGEKWQKWSNLAILKNLKLAVKQCYQTGQLFNRTKNWWKMPNCDILSYFQTIWSEGERTKIVTNWRVIPQFFIFLPQCSFRGSISFMAKKVFFYLFDNWIPYPQPFLDLKIDFFFQNQLSAMCEIPLVRYRNFLYQLVVLSSDFIIIHCACAWLQFAH